MSKQELRDYLVELFTSFSGQKGVLTIPRPYLAFCNGEHLAALLLSQIVYWSDRTDDPDGWFAKSYPDWDEELGMTEYKVRRVVNEILKARGVEVDKRRSPHYGYAPTLHYRVNKAVLSECILKFLQDRTLSNLSIESEATPESEPEVSSGSYTETISEITPESPAPGGASSPDSPFQEITDNFFGDDVPQLYPCTGEDVNALIAMYLAWVPRLPTKRGKVVEAKTHFANKTNREYAENLWQRGVRTADFAQCLGEKRNHPPDAGWPEMNFSYAAKIVESWVEEDRRENFYTPDCPRVTPRKPGVVIDLGEIANLTPEELARRYYEHPDVIVDVPPPYISPHEAEALDIEESPSEDNITLEGMPQL